MLALVELTEDVRNDRRDRISEIQAERDRGLPPFRRGYPPPPRQEWDEEIIREREVVYDSAHPRGRRYR